MKRKTLEQRIEDNIFYSPDGCWYWTGGVWRDNGRGRIKIKGKMKISHRVVYEMRQGPIPEGKMLCHHCDNPLCVNPNHLFPGDAMDNYLDMVNKGRRVLSPGIKNGGAKLNDAQVYEIRALKGVLKLREISDIYHVSGPVVSSIQNKKAWKHL